MSSSQEIGSTGKRGYRKDSFKSKKTNLANKFKPPRSVDLSGDNRMTEPNSNQVTISVKNS